MKKIISLLLAILFVVSFAGCKSDNKKEETKGLDIEYYAKLGQIPECEFGLKTNPEDIIDKYDTTEESGEEVSNFSKIEGEKTVLLDTGDANYYYQKKNKDMGIGYIISYDGGYGFKSGDISVEIKDAFADYDYSEETADADELFFMYLPENNSILRYTFGDNTVIFLFEDNALCATVIYSSKIWNF